MNLHINDEYFGELLPFIKDESVTDITWNGRDLWLDDLERGRYKSSVKLSDRFVATFSQRIANLANKNFNLSEPLLEAETDDLRISIVDGTVTNTNRSIAIRKTPAVRRLNELKMLESGYAEAMVLKLLEALVKGHSSIIVTGDVGSGKTELIKYLTKFIPSFERAISIEDNYELRLSAINPNLDCIEIKASQDGPFSYQMAIKAALRQLCKWLLMAEARSKEVINLLEAASTGCIVMTTLHSDDVRKIPDRVVNMMGIDGEEKRNDVYNFFDVGIKVGIQKTDTGIKRSIDQICVLDRDDNVNNLYLIYNRGFTGQTLPKNLWQKVVQGAKDDIALFEFLKPDNADSLEIIETPEFAEMVGDLEGTMKEDLLKEMEEQEKITARYGDSYVDNIDDLLGQGFFDENRINDGQISETSKEELTTDIDDAIFSGLFDDAFIIEEEKEEDLTEEEINELLSFLPENNDIINEDIQNILDSLDLPQDDIKLTEEMVDKDVWDEAINELLETPDDIDNILDIFDAIPNSLMTNDLQDDALMLMADTLGLQHFENLTREELMQELKKQLTLNWLNSLSEKDLIEELKREISVVEECKKNNIQIPEFEMLKIKLNVDKNRLVF